MDTGIIERLKAADKAYYNTGSPLMADAEYDDLREQAKAAFPDDQYFNGVGYQCDLRSSRKLLSHMGSLNKANSREEVVDWLTKGSGRVLLSQKLDGSSVEVVYRDGALSHVATRGDGLVGLDITENARRWPKLPHSIPKGGTVVIRGEAILSKHSWRQNFDGTANPRNAGNGTIARSDGRGNEFIDFVAFNAVVDGSEHATQAECFEFLETLGLRVVSWRPADTFEAADSIRNEYIAERDSLEFTIDGLVLCFDSKDLQRELGYSHGGTRPRGYIAWKFEAETASATILDFKLSQGQTGQIIPVIEITPVAIGGVVISRVLVNNFEFVSALGINIGDVVNIARKGDVIPYCTSLVEKKSKGIYQPPTNCISCGKPLVKDGKFLLCTDDSCDGRVFQRVKNWITKTGIKFIGDALLSAMFSADLVSDIDDLYGIKVDDLCDLQVGEGVLGRSVATRVISQIDATRELGLSTFMGSLGIKFLGRSMADHIGYSSVDDYLNATVSELSSRDNMGEAKATAMISSIGKRRELITRLLHHVKIAAALEKKSSSHSLSSKSFVFTGVRMKEPEKALFSEHCCVEKSGVSAGLDFLVAVDPDSDSSKAKKARQLGVRVISYQEFTQLLAGE